MIIDPDENFKFDFLLLFSPFFATMPTLAMIHGKSLKVVVVHCAFFYVAPSPVLFEAAPSGIKHAAPAAPQHWKMYSECVNISYLYILSIYVWV